MRNKKATVNPKNDDNDNDGFFSTGFDCCIKLSNN